jgi:nucleoside-diphosphate-sugar epimerase
MILLTGASGTVGVRLASALAARGHEVRVLVLPRDPGSDRLRAAGCQLCEGDLRRPDTLPPALAGVETVYHLAAVILSEERGVFRRVNEQGTAALLDAAIAAGVRHFIYVSSASIVYPRPTPYSRSKRMAEARVRAFADRLGITIVRPTLVYEPGGGLELEIFREYLRRSPLLLLPGGGTARKVPVHVDDLVQGLAAIAGNPRAVGKTYDLCGPEVVSLAELAGLLLAQDGRRRRVLPVPVWLCRAVAGVAGRLARRPQLAEHALAGLTQDALLDPRPAMEDLGYAPRGVRVGLTAHARRRD